MSTEQLQVSDGNSNDNPANKLVKLSQNDDKYCCIKSCSNNPGSENISRASKDKCRRPPTFKLQEGNWEVTLDWIQRICSSSWGQTFNPGVDEVCAEHFTEDCIQKSDTFILNGKKYSAPRSKLTWALRSSAVPTIFKPSNLPGPSSDALPIISRTLVGVRDPIASTWYWCETCGNILQETSLETHLENSGRTRNQLFRDQNESKTKTSSYIGHKIVIIRSPPVVKILKLSDFQIASILSKTEKRPLRSRTRQIYFEDGDLEDEDNNICKGVEIGSKALEHTGHQIGVKIARLSDFQIASFLSKNEKRPLRPRTRKIYIEDGDLEEDYKNITGAHRSNSSENTGHDIGVKVHKLSDFQIASILSEAEKRPLRSRARKGYVEDDDLELEHVEGNKSVANGSKACEYTGDKIARSSSPGVKVARLSDFQIASILSKTEKRPLRPNTRKIYFEDDDLAGEGMDKPVPKLQKSIRNKGKTMSQREAIDDNFMATRHDPAKVTGLMAQAKRRSRSRIETPPIFFCLLCVSHAFRDRFKLTHHMRSIHMDQITKTFKCPHCPKSKQNCTSVKAFNNHYRRLHLYRSSGFCPVPKREMMVKRDPFKCDQTGCNYVCRLESKIKIHKEMHEMGLIEPSSVAKREETSVLDTEGRSFVCTICKKSFKRRDHLRAHAKGHLKLSPFTCKFCNAKFGRKHSRDSHEELHWNRPTINCPICHGRLSRASSLPKHMKTCHPKDPRCKKSFILRKGILRIKPMIKNESEDVSSPQNGKPVLQNSSNSSSTDPQFPHKLMPTPMFEIIPKPEINETTGDCTQEEVGLDLDLENKSSKKNQNETDLLQSSDMESDAVKLEIEKLIGPIKNQYKLSQVKHKCHICSKVFRRAFPFQVHLETFHGIRDPWNKGYQDKKELSPQVEIVTSCGVCGFSSNDPMALKIHTKSHFPVGKNFPCRICGIRFTTEVKVNAHIKIIHEAPREHHCSSCGKAFVNSESLKCHMKQVHSEAFKGQFNCSDCDSKFQSLGGLKNHIKTTHSKSVETFKCQICSETLATRQSLQRHIRRVHIKSDVKDEVKESSKSEESLFL